MKPTLLKGLLFALAITTTAQAHASVSSDLDSLGTNAESIKRANRLESRSRVAIVQNRSVDRHWRFEVGSNFGAVAAGDSLINTQALSFDADLHISPKFSVGVRYSSMFNQLTAEGKSQFDAAEQAKQAGELWQKPQIDYPQSSLLGVIDWYMMYGKINFFDMSVVQFDIYSLLGAGQMQLASGPTPTYTAGGGIGFWFTNHITSRLELRYQGYQDQVDTGSRQQNLLIANFGLGWLL